MSASPGWYQEPDQPRGHLRYWDGLRWTDHRATAPRQPARRGAPQGHSALAWIGRHKAISAFIALFLLAWVAGTLDGDDAEPNVAPTISEPSSDGGDDPSTNVGPSSSDGASSDKPRPQATKTADAPGAGTAGVVDRVVDGDTVDLQNGETVRLLGIDAPEVGECGYLKASENLSGLVLDKRVQLVAGSVDSDRYGRILRYVDVGGLDAGLRLIENGFAIARYDSRDGYGFHPREPQYIAADAAAKDYTCPKPVPLAGGGRRCAPGYQPCVPPYPPDVDCPDVDGPVVVTGNDPHGLDGDGDGVACE